MFRYRALARLTLQSDRPLTDGAVIEVFGEKWEVEVLDPQAAAEDLTLLLLRVVSDEPVPVAHLQSAAVSRRLQVLGPEDRGDVDASGADA